MVKFMFYVEIKSLCALGNTTELNDLFVSFPAKGTCERVFSLKLQVVFYQLQFYKRWTSIVSFLLIFFNSTKHIYMATFIYCFHSDCFHKKKPVLLKLPDLITLLRRLDRSKEIHFAVSWPALIIKGRCNTLFKWHLVKCRFDSNWLPLDCWKIN